MPHTVGYCCLNTTLRKQKITTSRGMIQRTFKERGIKYASELALKNAHDLYKILEWNASQHISVFRVGSGIFPWASAYKLSELPDYTEIRSTLELCGHLAKTTSQRLSAHPDHFVKLASKNPSVVDNSIRDLEHHSEMFDLIGLEVSAYNPLNIHVGMNRSPDTSQRWIDAFHRLSENCRKRLVVENDDKSSGYSTLNLFTDLFSVLDIPITFDYFHHTFHTSGLSSQHAAELAAGTWPNGIIPLFHYSESKNVNENVTGNPRAHSDYVFHKIDDYGMTLHIDLEAKSKELALFNYRALL
jgi:UV DNA damage endonuclease